MGLGAYFRSHLLLKAFLHHRQEYCTVEIGIKVGKLFGQRAENEIEDPGAVADFPLSLADLELYIRSSIARDF